MCSQCFDLDYFKIMHKSEPPLLFDKSAGALHFRFDGEAGKHEDAVTQQHVNAFLGLEQGTGGDCRHY